MKALHVELLLYSSDENKRINTKNPELGYQLGC